ncbi:hypothetical protein B0H13DRAFT_2352284 [Mycena leptocephala]|nr:hypothetical protein B0H13DRAFT_2352284 [Mycena leptocephala]
MVDHDLVLVAYESERQGHPRVFNCPIALCFFVSTLQRLSFHFHLLDNQNIIPILYTSFVSFQDLITRLLNFASIMDPAGADAIANAFNTLQSLVQQYQPGSIAGPPQSASQGAVDSASIRPAPVTSYISTRPPRPLAYMPSAARGHPNAATTGSLPSSYQPFLGTSSLAVYPTEGFLVLGMVYLFAKENIPTFTKPRLLIRKGRLLINFIVARPGIICKTIRESSYRRSGTLRRHSCLPAMMHSLFSPENEVGAGVSRWVAPVCESDGETDDEMEVEDSLFGSDVENLPPTPTPVVRPTNRNAVALAAGSSTLSTVPIQQTNNEPSQTTSSTVSSSLSVESHNTTAPWADNVSPPTAETIDLTNDAAVEDTPTVTQLWANNWVAQPAQYGSLFESSYFAKSLFETASSASNPPELVVQGQDMAELASNLIAQIRAAAANKNFTPVMSSSRTFKMRVYTCQYSQMARSSQLGMDSSEKLSTLPFMLDCNHHVIIDLSLRQQRCRESLTVLGCLAALMLIHGIAPEPLSPAFIQFAAHQCDIQSLTRDFVGKWHAELRALINDWNAMGPEGDLTPFQAHFATYHDIPIASLQNRDLSQHRALATDMLYTALIGPHPPSHSELKAFLTGFQISCSNGFDFRKVICPSPGGSSMLISRTWTSIIHDFASLQPHLEVFSVHRSNLRSIAGSAHPVADMDLCDMLYSFLRGSGAPCPNLFTEAIPNLSPLIPFDQVGTVSFRSRALCCATAGCPNVEFDENQQLSVYFVGPNETGYHNEPDTRAAYMQAGLISFRTCFRTARIPISHLVELHNRSYPTLDTAGNPAEPFTVEQAVDNWLLLQILAGIGRHSFL